MRLIRGTVAAGALVVLLVLAAATVYVAAQLAGTDVPLPDDVADLPTVPSTVQWTIVSTTSSTVAAAPTPSSTTSTVATADAPAVVTVPAYSTRSGDVGDTLTLPDLGGTPISVGVVHVEDPGAPQDPSAGSRTVAVFVTYVFHGADLADADPRPPAVPSGFVVHDTLGTVHWPASPTEDCDASFGDTVTPGVPVSACVPFEVPGSLPVFAVEWSLAASPTAPHGDLSWIAP